MVEGASFVGRVVVRGISPTIGIPRTKSDINDSSLYFRFFARAQINGMCNFRDGANSGRLPARRSCIGLSLVLNDSMCLITLRLRRFALLGFWQLYNTQACSAGLEALASNLSEGLRSRAIRMASSCELFPGIKQGNESTFRRTIAAPESTTDGLYRFLDGTHSFRRKRPTQLRPRNQGIAPEWGAS